MKQKIVILICHVPGSFCPNLNSGGDFGHQMAPDTMHWHQVKVLQCNSTTISTYKIWRGVGHICPAFVVKRSASHWIPQKTMQTKHGVCEAMTDLSTQSDSLEQWLEAGASCPPTAYRKLLCVATPTPPRLLAIGAHMLHLLVCGSKHSMDLKHELPSRPPTANNLPKRKKEIWNVWQTVLLNLRQMFRIFYRTQQ